MKFYLKLSNHFSKTLSVVWLIFCYFMSHIKFGLQYLMEYNIIVYEVKLNLFNSFKFTLK